MNVIYEFDESLIKKDFSPFDDMVGKERWEDFDIYEKHAVFSDYADEEMIKDCVLKLYKNFIDSQINLGKKLIFCTWWEKPHPLSGLRRIGWCAFCKKNNEIIPGCFETKESLRQTITSETGEEDESK